jgi:hypothetical protein
VLSRRTCPSRSSKRYWRVTFSSRLGFILRRPDRGYRNRTAGTGSERFYIVESGRAEVVRDRRVVETLGRGNCFGESALLRDEPRTASVRASADANMRVSVLQRTTYLTAVTGYDTGVRLQEIGDQVGITERAAHRIGGELGRRRLPRARAQAPTPEADGLPRIAPKCRGLDKERTMRNELETRLRAGS